jgi:hypothetical protein
MDGHLFNKLADMHLMYGSGQGAVLLCQETSHTNAIQTIKYMSALLTCRNIKTFAVNWGRDRSIQTPDLVEHTLDHV